MCFARIAHLFRTPFIAIAMVIGFGGLHSCENIYEVPKEDIEDAEEFAQSLGLVLSALEPIEHINSTYSFSDFNRKNFDSIEKILGCELVLIDSSTQDGNGMEYEVLYNGQTNKMDRKLRSGKISVKINYSHREVGSVTQISIDDQTPIKISTANKFIGELHGEFEFQRNVGDKVDLVIKSMNFNIDDEDDALDEKMNATLTYSWLVGESTQGLVFDQLKFSGKGSVELDEKEFNFNINLPLEKLYEFGCSDYILKGIVELKKDENQFKIDFDPFNNNACNDIVKIYKNGKEFEVRVP